MNPAPSQSSDVKFEIGHVLFIDIVGYSKLLINEQSEQIQKLKEIVRGTEQFRSPKLKGNYFVFRRVMALRSFFEPARKRRPCVRSRSAGNSRSIPSFAFAWEFTAGQSMKSRT